MKIGIDIDGCLYHWTLAANEAIEAKFGIEGLTEHTHWDYLYDSISPAQWAWLWSGDAAERVFGRTDLIFDGASLIVNDLCEYHEVHFMTHRNPELTAEITSRWLENWFHGYAGVHILQSSVPKTTLGNWDLFIDDKPDTISAFEKIGTPILVPDRLYNQGYGSYRFDSWDLVPGLVDHIFNPGIAEQQLVLEIND